MSSEHDNVADGHGSPTDLPPQDATTTTAKPPLPDVSVGASDNSTGPSSSSTTDDIKPILPSGPTVALLPSSSSNLADDAEGESEVEGEGDADAEAEDDHEHGDERDQLGNESEISAPATPSPPPTPAARSKPRSGSDGADEKYKGGGGLYDNPREKIARVFQACEHCKKRKCRCDGVQPACKVCTRLNIQCVYAPERKMRGPSRNKKNWPGSKRGTSRNGGDPAGDSATSVPPDAASSSNAVYNPYLPQKGSNGDAAPVPASPPATRSAAKGPQASAANGEDEPPSSFPRYVAQPVADPWANIPLPPHTNKPYSLPAIIQENPHRFPSQDVFQTFMDSYLKSLLRKGGDKALPTQKMYDAVLAILRDDTDADTMFDSSDEYAGSPIFRVWALKSFKLAKIPKSASEAVEEGETEEAVLYNGKPLAVREQLYNIMVCGHAAARHGGRDKTCAVINEQYSWVPKALVEAFVKACPGCPRKLIKNEDRSADSVVATKRKGKRRNRSEDSPMDDEAAEDASDELAAPTALPEAPTNGSAPRKRLKMDTSTSSANGDASTDAASISTDKEMVMA